MKKMLIVLIPALILLGAISMASAGVFIAAAQRVYFDSTNSSFYWAFIWDYTDGYRESAVLGYIDYDTDLAYNNQIDGVQVAYIYSVVNGRYEEALALRDVNL